MRSFRFGVTLSRADSAHKWTDMAREAEALGYDIVVMPDHFGARFAPIPALTAVACATRTIRIGTLVLANDFRHPALLAKEAATIDVLSNGRFELGLGAGWLRADYERIGIPMDPFERRVERLRESIRIIKALLSGQVLTYPGDHYHVSDLRIDPPAVQKPRIPVLVGGGSRAVLKLAAAEADIVGIHPSMRGGERGFSHAAWDSTGAAFEKKFAFVRSLLGARLDSVSLNCIVYVALIQRDVEAGLQEASKILGLDHDEAKKSPLVLVAKTSQEAAELLLSRRDRYGLTDIVIRGTQMVGFAPVVQELAGQ